VQGRQALSTLSNSSKVNTKSNVSGAAIRDWIAVSLFLFWLALLCMHSSSISAYKTAKNHSEICVDVCLSEQEILQCILPFGATVADIYNHIPITESIDLEKRFMEEKLRDGVIFVVPEKNKTSVYVKGSVKQNRLYRLPESATYKDLLPQLEIQKDANFAAIKRRRRVLREGEIIEISPKNVRK
jgi:hypothetical protein